MSRSDPSGLLIRKKKRRKMMWYIGIGISVDNRFLHQNDHRMINFLDPSTDPEEISHSII